MNVEYNTSLAQRTWTLPPEHSKKGHTVTFGFWVKETVDQILEPESREARVRLLGDGLVKEIRN